MPVAVVLHFEDQAIGHHESHHVGRRPGVLAGVGQTFAHDGENVVAHVLGHGVVHRSFEAHLGAAPEVSRHLVGEVHDRLAQAAGQGGVPELEDGRADLGDGVVELVDGLGDPFDDQVPFGEARRALEAHADGVDALDDPVVEIAGDAVAVVEDAHDADAVVEPGVLNGDARGEREGFGKGLVLVGELGRTLLVRQVEVAVDVVSDTQRDAQEGGHGRVPGREAVAARVLFEVLEAQRLGFGDQEPEHAPARWALPDDLLFGVTEPDGDELFEPGAGLVEDSEGGVAGTDEGLGPLRPGG